MDTIFIEKYRPQEWPEVIGLPPELPGLVGQQMPHLLLAGPAGTGKTSIAKIIIRKLDADYLYLNASDERGIQVIRDKVKVFASTQGVNPGIKIVFLDEADGLTPDAQDSLRSIIEEYHKHCRFIFTCNYINKIYEPIKSRCTVFTLDKPEREAIVGRLQQICYAENLAWNPVTAQRIADIARTDIRKAINLLQRHRTTLDNPDSISRPNEIVDSIMAHLLDKDTTDKIEWWMGLRGLLAKTPPSYEELFSALLDQIVESSEITSEQKERIILAMPPYCFWQVFVADKDLNFAVFCLEIRKVLFE